MWRPACGKFPECLDDELAGIKAYHVLAVCSDSQSSHTISKLKEIGTTQSNMLVASWVFAFNRPCFWRVDTELTTGKRRTGELWSYRATWQTCKIRWITCGLAVLTWKNSDKSYAGKVKDVHHLRTLETYYMQCTIPDSYKDEQGPLGGNWLDARVNIPKGSRLHPVVDAPLWQEASTSGTSGWVLEAEQKFAQASFDGPEGVPIGKKRAECRHGRTSLSGQNVTKACVPGTVSVATNSVYCEDFRTYQWKIKTGQIFRARKTCEHKHVTGPGTYTFALKAKSKNVQLHTTGPEKPALGLTVCNS
eukprot:gnl/TRDRNA2_/TRDRNA2_69404_c0_seq1.p1 gnl/TRDRNA2_/TRDRNA2_69404_c0~~gnl/TRDRNA2_/TRDRNA2_69404_c0_seq1.p1  ORF type:complete len:314 (-),score=35.83 gnl/TRDRNA2_/TRDRNA2_69404_c0_seq1:237-1151(-)